MSEKPVAQLDAYSEGFADAMQRLQEYVEQARALAIAECLRVSQSCIDSCVGMDYSSVSAASVAFDLSGNILNAIRALSPAPSVSEEWVWDVATGDKFYRDDSVDLYAAVRATLAALGVEIRAQSVPEIFPGTMNALNSLGVRK